jgi:hypothetical protein
MEERREKQVQEAPKPNPQHPGCQEEEVKSLTFRTVLEDNT